MTIVFLNFSDGAKTYSWHPLPLFTLIFLLAWLYVFFWHYHLMRMSLIRPYRKVHTGCTLSYDNCQDVHEN